MAKQNLKRRIKTLVRDIELAHESVKANLETKLTRLKSRLVTSPFVKPLK